MRLGRLAVLFGFACHLPFHALALVWTIDPTGGGDYSTIQAGISSAGVGDTLILANAIYSGRSNWDLKLIGKSLTFQSASDDPSLCVLDLSDPEGGHTGFRFYHPDESGSLVRGISVINGEGYSGGG